MDKDQQKELLETIYKSLQEAASNITSIYEVQWNSRNDGAKTLLTISSAAIVITISLLVAPSNLHRSSFVSGVARGLLARISSVYFMFYRYIMDRFETLNLFATIQQFDRNWWIEENCAAI